MKLKVYKEKEKKEKSIYFKLSECNANAISLDVVDEHGNEVSQGTILFINQKGLHLNCGIDKNIGLSLDKETKIVINELTEPL